MKDILKGQWHQLEGRVKQTWGELTDDDVKKTEGDLDQLVGVIQERYGYAKEQARQQVAEFIQRLKNSDDTPQSEATSTEPRLPTGARS